MYECNYNVYRHLGLQNKFKNLHRPNRANLAGIKLEPPSKKLKVELDASQESHIDEYTRHTEKLKSL